MVVCQEFECFKEATVPADVQGVPDREMFLSRMARADGARPCFPFRCSVVAMVSVLKQLDVVRSLRGKPAIHSSATFTDSSVYGRGATSSNGGVCCRSKIKRFIPAIPNRLSFECFVGCYRLTD